MKQNKQIFRITDIKHKIVGIALISKFISTIIIPKSKVQSKITA